MPSAGGSGARNADSGGRQSTGSRRSNNSTPAEQAEARASRLNARGGAANAKNDDGMSEAARALTQSSTPRSRTRLLQDDSSSEDHDGLDAAGVLKVSQLSQGRERLKKASHQPVHAFMFDCNTCLTHHSIFFAGTHKQYPQQRRPASPEHFARARHVQGARHPEQGQWPKQRCLAVHTVAVTVVTGPKCLYVSLIAQQVYYRPIDLCFCAAGTDTGGGQRRKTAW